VYGGVGVAECCERLRREVSAQAQRALALQRRCRRSYESLGRLASHCAGEGVEEGKDDGEGEAAAAAGSSGRVSGEALLERASCLLLQLWRRALALQWQGHRRRFHAAVAGSNAMAGGGGTVGLCEAIDTLCSLAATHHAAATHSLLQGPQPLAPRTATATEQAPGLGLVEKGAEP